MKEEVNFRSALHIAVENENIEMIELLLDNNIETGDAILYAIGEENVEAVEIILEHLEKIEKFNPEVSIALPSSSTSVFRYRNFRYFIYKN